MVSTFTVFFSVLWLTVMIWIFINSITRRVNKFCYLDTVGHCWRVILQRVQRWQELDNNIH